MATIYPVIHRMEGLKEIEAALKGLRNLFGVKTGGIVIRGLRKGAVLIRDDARRRAPEVPKGFVQVRTGGGRGKNKTMRMNWAAPVLARQRLISNIVEHAIPTDSRLAGGKPTVLVRVRNRGYTRTSTGAIRFNRPGSSPGWWWWLEFGTSIRAAQPFIRPAFEAQKVAAAEAAKQSMRQEIEEHWQKFLPSFLGKKAA